MKESFTLRFLYKTLPGRMVLKLLIQPKVSKITGRYLSSGASKWLVPYYIRKHNINMRGIEVPENGFSSFNEFFTRKKKVGRQELKSTSLISPCDGFLTCITIKNNLIFNIKHTKFSLEDLLKDKRLASKFHDGTALIFRLTPANYHRYCYAADGQVLRTRTIPGTLHCVRPIALGEFPVFAQNSREYQIIKTQSFGTMVQMEIGALMVGKINNHRQDTGCVLAGREKGTFEFGGSTIILLFTKNAACFRKELFQNEELPIHMGDFLT